MRNTIQSAKIYLKTARLPVLAAGTSLRQTFSAVLKRKSGPEILGSAFRFLSVHNKLEAVVRSIARAQNLKEAVDIALADGIIRTLGAESVQLYYIFPNRSVRVAEIIKRASPQNPLGPNDKVTATVRDLPLGSKIHRLDHVKSHFHLIRHLGSTHTLKNVVEKMEPLVVYEPKPEDRDTKPYILFPMNIGGLTSILIKVKKGASLTPSEATFLITALRKPLSALADKIRSQRLLLGPYIPVETRLTQTHLENEPLVFPSILSIPSLKDKLLAGQSLEENIEEIMHVVEKLVKAKASGIHLDIMDGQFVEVTTTGPFKQNDPYFSQASDVNLLAAKIRKRSQIPIDCHLMVRYPKQFIYGLARAGVDIITIHAEENVGSTSARPDLGKLLDIITYQGIKAAVSINPETSVEEIEPHLDQVSMVLIMSVVPGKGGQSFMPETAEKLKQLKKIREEKGLHFGIQVDGGINDKTIPSVLEFANIRVAGSFLTSAINDPEQLAKRINILLGKE